MKKFEIGDIVRFKKSDDWSKFLPNNYEIGFIRSGGNVKLQSIKTKERLPQTYNLKSLIIVRKNKK